MAIEVPVAHVEWLVVDEETDDLAIGHVDHRLARFGVPEPRFGVRQRAKLVEAVEISSRQAVGLALVEVAPQADVAVGEGEDRLALAEDLEVQLGLANPPGVDGEATLTDHGRFVGLDVMDGRDITITAQRDTQRLRQQLEDREEELTTLRRETVQLKKEREDIRGRVEKMLAQIESLAEAS